MDIANEIRWAPRVLRQEVLRLYQMDAKGIRDEELVDEVGFGLLARCESIRIVSDAYRGRIECPRCTELLVNDGKGPSRSKQYPLLCAKCGWQMLWGEYHKSFQGQQLRGQNFEPELNHFLQHFPKARTPSDKMVLIDRLIHAVHKGTAKPAAVNLLSGSAGQLAVFLDGLAYGEGSTSGVKQTKAEWDARIRSSRYWGKKLEELKGSD